MDCCRNAWLRGVAFALLALLAGCANPHPAPPPALAPLPEQPVFSQTGTASWYGHKHDGHRTANGEIFNSRALTAAHRSLPFGTVVRVTNLVNGRTIKVRINDRGPYVRSRIIDLSTRAARDLGILERGVVPVKVEEYASDQVES